VVLVVALHAYPRWSSMRDLRQEIGCGGVVHHAVRDLVEVGLIERREGQIRPTPAAAHFEQLKLP
jgi:hypothetical protein